MKYMKVIKKKTIKGKKKNRSGMGFVIATVLVLFAVITYNKAGLDAKNRELQKEKAKYEKQLGRLEEEHENIEEYRDYVKSDENIENVAREKLGLVYPGDVVFEAED